MQSVLILFIITILLPGNLNWFWKSRALTMECVMDHSKVRTQVLVMFLPLSPVKLFA